MNKEDKEILDQIEEKFVLVEPHFNEIVELFKEEGCFKSKEETIIFLKNLIKSLFANKKNEENFSILKDKEKLLLINKLIEIIKILAKTNIKLTSEKVESLFLNSFSTAAINVEQEQNKFLDLVEKDKLTSIQTELKKAALYQIYNKSANNPQREKKFVNTFIKDVINVGLEYALNHKLDFKKISKNQSDKEELHNKESSIKKPIKSRFRGR